MFGLGQKIFGAGPAVHRQDVGGGSGASVPATVVTSVAATGLASSTKIATAMGWRPVEAIAVGDLVLTFDRGLQPVRQVHRSIAWIEPRDVPKALWPLFVPARVLGNDEPMVLLPDQLVMLESDAAELVWGDPFTLIAAADLEGFRGIMRVAPEGPTQTVVLEFDHDEVVFVQNGALAFCGQVGPVSLEEVMTGRPATYRSVDSQTARDLLDCIEFDETPFEGYAPDQPGQAGQAAFA